MNSITFDSNGYAGISVFGHKTVSRGDMTVLLKTGETPQSSAEIATETFMLHFPLRCNTAYCLALDGGDFDLVYLDTGENTLHDGIRFLTDVRYDQAYRNQCHFSPPVGWMNDPNGLCVYNGYIHLFYQFNPFAQVWGNMHWGHAVSTDLMHWKHMPVVFFPQRELQDRRDLRGGAFSGSALVKDDTMHVFFTRHYGAHDRSWAKERQVKASSIDGVEFTGEHDVLDDDAGDSRRNFRDPKIFEFNNYYFMVIGGDRNAVPTVFLYRSKDTEHWEFVSDMYTESDKKYAVAECPDLFFLDGKWVLIIGFINSDPVSDIQRDVKYMIGTFDGEKFIPESSGLLDYGKDFYAVQTFLYRSRRICFGWNSDQLKSYRPQRGSANGTLSFPRELHVADGTLVQIPVEELYSLETEGDALSVRVPFLIKMESDGQREFVIDLVASPEGNLSLVYRNGALLITVAGIVKCTKPIAYLKDMEIIVDASLVELFINEGSTVMTARYYLEGDQTAMPGMETNQIKEFIKLYRLNGIWENYDERK